MSKILFNFFSYSFRYLKKFETTRKPKRSIESMEDTKTTNRYIGFIKEVSKIVYKDLYGKDATGLNPNLLIQKKLELASTSEEELILQDLMNESIFSIVM